MLTGDSVTLLYITKYIHIYTYTHKKRRPHVAYSSTEAFALPYNSNKQQETYADMTTARQK